MSELWRPYSSCSLNERESQSSKQRFPNNQRMSPIFYSELTLKNLSYSLGETSFYATCIL